MAAQELKSGVRGLPVAVTIQVLGRLPSIPDRDRRGRA